jgi:FkbM family methyltransferase
MTPETMLLAGLHLNGKTVYDVGGHKGHLTMFFARQVGETGNVVTFEPNPHNHATIIDHIELNGFSNVQVLQMGLGVRQESLEFVVPDSARGTASPEKQRTYADREGLQVFQIDLDTMDHQIAVQNLTEPNFVKIDVEGLEMEVLRGMTQTMSKNRPAILVELHGVREVEVVELLLDHNYRVHQVEDGIDITRQNIQRVRGHLYATPRSTP